ncbi:MAG: 3-dehydroquinate synthase [Sedimentisphaerales bacterium]|nr:3-dehydroquinate synthase [Sedimentisphaerales bacterium]
MIHYPSDSPARTVTVDLGQRSYPIYIGSDILGRFGEAFESHCGRRRAVIISDQTVWDLYGPTVEQSLRRANVETQAVSVPPGEKSKCLAMVEMIYGRLFEFSTERSDVIVALGGGVVGDLAGFVAATFKRGLPYVQVPSSLLAMVDSSIGGKTGINHPRGKNMIGAFHQPQMVFADCATLKTLPARELGCGLAETVKHGIIRDAAFFASLEANSQPILALEPDRLIELVERNCRIKAAVVSADEREAGLRGILNCGHTIGHALETVWASRGGDIHHGEAVSLGLVAAGRLALRRSLLRPDELERIRQLLGSFRLPVRIEPPGGPEAIPANADRAACALPGDLPEIPLATLYEAMRHDKKVQAGRIRFALPKSIGNCVFQDDLTESEIKQAISSLGE